MNSYSLMGLTCKFVLSDWLTCKTGLLGACGKARHIVILITTVNAMYPYKISVLM